MRILQVYGPYDPPVYGGIQRILNILRDGVPRFGHELVTLCASHDRVTRVDHGPRGTVVHAASFGKVLRHRLSPSLPFWIRKLRPDVLHFHYPSLSGVASCLITRPARPVVVSYHCDVQRRGWHRVFDAPVQAFLRRADRILVSTPQTLDASHALRPHRDRCEVLPYGLDLERLRETDRTREVTRALRESCAGPITLFVGRFHHYKGLDVLLEALPNVPGTLVLVGRGEEYAAVRSRVREGGLSARVRFAEEVPDEDLGGYYRAADLFVLPSTSRAESFGLAMAEAMACGLPAVSTRLGTGTSFVNQDGVTGLEVEAGDAGALAEAMRKLLEDPEEARRMGEAARGHAAGFSLDRMVEETVRMYETMGRRNPSGSTRGS
ncbi:MAG: glycosyltransferase [Candidatus Eisenbacteria bacterium]|nr:glycosyltransferase [Candidatus Eisenbacteria bacterium]